jgi:hypothetical protein
LLCWKRQQPDRQRRIVNTAKTFCFSKILVFVFVFLTFEVDVVVDVVLDVVVVFAKTFVFLVVVVALFVFVVAIISLDLFVAAVDFVLVELVAEHLCKRKKRQILNKNKRNHFFDKQNQFTVL